MKTKFLVVISLILMSFVFAACPADKPDYPDYPDYPNYPSDDEEESVDFSNLYGYWLNSDKTGAMAISEYSKTQCRIKYYAYPLDGQVRLYEQESYYSNNGSFTALVPISNGCYNEGVKISLSSYEKIILTHFSGSGNLSSYIFSRVSEKEFFDYLENGGSSGSQSGDDEEEDKLFGTWKGKEDEWTIKLTFYPSGKAVEEWSDGYYSDVTTGTYTYSNGKITKWDMEDGSSLCNTIGDCPWPVVFSSSTSMTLGSGYSKITFTKQ